MRHRFAAVAFVAAVLSGCGGSSVQPTPVGDAVNGTWAGTAGTTTVTVAIHSLGESGILLGTGTVINGSTSRAVNIQGSYVQPSDMSIEMLTTGFDVYFTGQLSSSSMTGSLQESAAGYNGLAITLKKHSNNF